MLKYIIRLDDACPTMDWKRWDSIFNILDKYKIKPIVAVVPNNKDKKLIANKARGNFWEIVKRWEDKGYYIAMHGYNHKYISKKSGLIPMNNQSEFAGVDQKLQRNKIKKAWSIFISNKIKPKIWIAPSHTFDKNTLKILKEETEIEVVSDGIAYYPYNRFGFVWIPQQLWWFSLKKYGIWTICLHPNNMSMKKIYELDNILNSNLEYFVLDLNEVIDNFKNRTVNIKDNLFFYKFFTMRKLSIIKNNLFKNSYEK